jgi:hypothetical protein
LLEKDGLRDPSPLGDNGMIVLDKAFTVEDHKNAVHVKILANGQNLNHMRENCAVGVSYYGLTN